MTTQDSISKPRLVLVAGIGHSGTTILDAVLGCAPEIMGIGETLRMLSPTAPKNRVLSPAWFKLREGKAHEIMCTCGADLTQCEMWGDVLPEIGQRDMFELLVDIHARALRIKPTAHTVVESTPAALAHIDTLKRHFDVRIIHVTRDVRSWAASRARRKGTRNWVGHLIWYRHVRTIERQVSAAGVDTFHMGYEEFALRPIQTLGKLCDWLGASYVEEMLTPFGRTGSHIISGNGSIKKPDLTRRVQYDGHWMAASQSSLLSNLIFTGLAGRNHRLVYSNGIVGRSAKPGKPAPSAVQSSLPGKS